MSTTAVAYTPVSPENAPALFKGPDWLPADTGIPELDQLRPTYERINSEWSAASAEVWRLKDALEAVERRREQTLRDAVLAGSVAPEPEDTSATEAELEQARTRSRAAGQALVAHVNEAVALIVEHCDEWVAQADERDAVLVTEAEALEAQLREIRARLGGQVRDAKGQPVTKLHYWLMRTAEAAYEPALHFPYAEIPDAPPPEGTEEYKQWQDQIAERAQYDGTAYKKVDDAEGERIAAEVGSTYNEAHAGAVEDASAFMSEETLARMRAAAAAEPEVVA